MSLKRNPTAQLAPASVLAAATDSDPPRQIANGKLKLLVAQALDDVECHRLEEALRRLTNAAGPLMVALGEEAFETNRFLLRKRHRANGR